MVVRETRFLEEHLASDSKNSHTFPARNAWADGKCGLSNVSFRYNRLNRSDIYNSGDCTENVSVSCRIKLIELHQKPK